MLLLAALAPGACSKRADSPPASSVGAPGSAASGAESPGQGRSERAAAGAENGVVNVSGAQARELAKQGALLLDVRTAEEFADGHLDGAKNIPVDRVEAEM